MVDWDRVEEDRSKGWDWEKIAADPKVGFHPDTSVTQPGRALRSLYHRHRSRQDRKPEPEAAPSKKDQELKERKWTMVRFGFLFTPLVGVWFLFAYFLPSPVGLLVPAIPWLALALAVAAFVLLFGLWRTSGPRWSKQLRTTLVVGVVLGLVLSGFIVLGGYIVGCPTLSSNLGSNPGPGWGTASAPAWQENGAPVMYFYGATWCPYCSASSWAIWKAMTEFQSGFNGSIYGIPGTSFMYSNPGDVYPSTPEVVLGSASVNSPVLSWQVSEYFWTQSSGTAGTFPSTGNCVQQAYVTAYAGGSIPFLVINGQYVHGGSSLINPQDLSTWANGGSGGATAVATSVLQENSAGPWGTVEPQAAWICAFVLKSAGYGGSGGVAAFILANAPLHNPSRYQWTPTFQADVQADLTQLG